MNYQKGIKDPNLERHSNKGKSRHFPVNGLSSVSQSSSSNDTRNIYNNPYTSTLTSTTAMQQQQQQQQQQMRHQQLSQHVYKSIAGTTGSGNSYEYSTPNPTDQQAAGVSNSHLITDAENSFLNHNNGKYCSKINKLRLSRILLYVGILRCPSLIYFYCNICPLNIYVDSMADDDADVDADHQHHHYFKPFLWSYTT
ncbi:uncharacterized protein LOC142235289 [Haematobia irritans]|uniref:uncharacterized protein LOC142235289 n=1 Tax=Haematobia irritans TaxID=7368 RepID=UPI003F4FE08E